MPPIREILVVPHTHHDVGYTHMPDRCLETHEQAIHAAIALCERDADRDAPDAFRWTLEISRPLLEFLRHAPAADLARLQRLARHGRVAVTAGYLHMTQLIGHEEYVRFFDPVREFRRHGLPVSVVQHGDINGLSWGLVPLMREAGLDCLVMALNPDHGRAPFEQPSAFYWEGPDGGRVLVWLSMHYSTGNNPWELAAGRIDAAIAPIAALIARTEARADYPFDFLVVHTAEDNMLPNGYAAGAVRAWNATGLQPPLRIATIDMVVARVRAQAGGVALPVARGEWADWWAHGHGSSAFEVGVSRLARAEARAAETGRALGLLAGAEMRGQAAPGALPIVNWYRAGNVLPVAASWAPRMDAVYDNLLLFAEHTWGTFESVTLPDSLFTRAHWNAKARFAHAAVAEARELARGALSALAGALPPAATPALVVLNATGAPASEVVSVRIPGEDRAVWVPDLPPLGVRVVPWSPAEPDDLGPPEPQDGGGPVVLENRYYRLVVDPGAGAIRALYDKDLQKDWVDPDAPAGLGAVVYEQPAAGETHPAVTESRRHFHPDTPGPRFTYTPATGRGSVTVRRAAYGAVVETRSAGPYLPDIHTTITLYDTVKRIDLSVTLDKVENYAMEGVYVLFPFALAGPTFRLETANAEFRADLDQLPDTCRDWYSIQHGAAITDGAASVLWATREAPLIQVGGFHTGEWARRLHAPRGHICAWLMNNLYFTNFKAAQGGRSSFHFRFTTQAGGLAGGEARRWGDAFATPPVARLAPVAPGSYRWLDIAPATVVTQILKPARAEDGAIILRLKETSGAPVTAAITWRGPGEVDLFPTNFLETARGAPLARVGAAFHLPLQPHQLATVLIAPRPGGPDAPGPVR
jgi:alpha-mannosidase